MPVVRVQDVARAPTPAPSHYPPARRDNTVDHYFGTAVPAPYRWMENMQDPALHAWVEAENRFSDSYLAKIPLRDRIATRLTELWNHPTETTPIQIGGPRLFFRRNAGLQNQSVLYVRESASAAPRVLLDPNILSEDGSTALAGAWPSPDGKYLAYALSEGGSDWRIVRVMEVASGKLLPDVVRWLKFSNVAWTNDDKGFFYSRYPQPAAGNAISQEIVQESIYHHALGAAQSADRLIYSRPDLPHWIIEGSLGESGRYFFVTLVNGTGPQNELYIADLGDPLKPNIMAPLKPFYAKDDIILQPVEIKDDILYLQTNLDAPRQRIAAATLSDPVPAHWRTVVPEGKGVMQFSGIAGGRLVVDSQIDATSRVDLYDLNGKSDGSLPLPAPGTVYDLSARMDSSILYYNFTSFLYPTSIYRYDLRSKALSVEFQPHTGFDVSRYDTKQVSYPSRDGTKVPMFIVAPKNLKQDGVNPTILYGYGGFDITITPLYKPILPVWLEQGGVYAVANLRGGDTYGEAWHRAGMLGNKQNVFDDFAWAAKYLFANGYTSPKHLGIQGYSNGGLLTGASITERPQLFGAAYVGHGVLDMLRYQHFSGGALWGPEYGLSDDPKAFQWLHAYSPLHNVKDGTCYPPTLITTSWDDDRVVPMHEFKFAAALQHGQGCDNPILLRTTGGTAHSYMPTDKDIVQTADIWAFEGQALGMASRPDSTIH
jgi:prolyl oligopeptidase